ncbi:hypothetical protein BSF38_04435 [Paludisphaera borealis]|uniref:Uncharacterized protein n=1 Tax=Paludisphaera borealis TaxID=1387353 RepID=A0A1U7CVG1_9BACT|nr:hypothetical protein BSF38_04435 [Paludisphaera borealis]
MAGPVALSLGRVGRPKGMGNVTERNRFSRWRRLPPVFRSGEHKLPGYEDETQRLTVYLPGSLLDLAEELAELANVPTIQEYCTRLLAHALENERVSRQVADLEVQRGPLEGLKEIAQDPQYLAEWRNQLESRDPRASDDRSDDEADTFPELTVPIAFLPDLSGPDEAGESSSEDHDGEAAVEPLTIRIETRQRFVEPVVSERMVPEVIDGRALDVVWNHVAPGDADAQGFLPCLRRGEPPSAARTAELLAALRLLEEENRSLEGLDRRLAYALHRLSLESQVLMTEAWPGAFDEPTIGSIRAVQEMVERIISGEDVRFYSNAESQATERES